MIPLLLWYMLIMNGNTMNENLNLIEILKDCPKGTELYSLVYGVVYFSHIREDYNHPIVYTAKDNNSPYYSTTSKGLVYKQCDDGECVLFPSKNQRDWSKFSIFKDGDILFDGTSTFIFTGKYYNGNPCAYCGIATCNNFLIPDETDHWTTDPIRFATTSETLAFFNKMEKAGYMWNADTKKLVSLIKEGDVVMVANSPAWWAVRHYFKDNLTQEYNCGAVPWKYIVPIHKFVFKGNFEENIKHSIIPLTSL